MKNKLILLAMLGIAFLSNAQVGINNTSPASTLDITAKNATGTSTNVDGLLIPRIDRQRAQGMTGIPISTLIYVDNVSTGTQAGTSVNIDVLGYYYYNGTVWTKLNSAADTNIYNTDGSLTGNRTVTQGSNTLAFTTNQVNGFSVDGSTLSVDAVNKRIGMGTSTPLYRLDLGQAAQVFTNPIKVLGIHTDFANGDGFYGFGMASDRMDLYAGYSAASPAPKMVIIGSSGSVGIGTTSPSPFFKLDVNGNINASGNITSQGVIAANGNINSIANITASGDVTGKRFIATTTGSIYADYVFESYYKGFSNINPDYKFVKLDDVEHFIKKNGHLPGYQSIDEVKKNDFKIDISKNTLTNMEKIEELYLHLIDLKKEVEKLKKENKKLKKCSNK